MLFPPILTDPVKMATPFLLCLLVSFAALVIANPEITIRANPETGLLEDGLGRVRVFHGVNAVYKEHPWHPNFDGFDPFNSLVEKDMVVMPCVLSPPLFIAFPPNLCYLF